MISREYTPGETLGENEFLLKLRDDSYRQWNSNTQKYEEHVHFKTGFLTKLTKKGEVPKAFESWGAIRYNGPKPDTYVWQETYRSGWKLKSWRIGKSQEWAKVQHPEGFQVEIYLSNFLEIVQNETIDQGVIVGEYRWEDNKLIKKV